MCLYRLISSKASMSFDVPHSAPVLKNRVAQSINLSTLRIDAASLCNKLYIFSNCSVSTPEYLRFPAYFTNKVSNSKYASATNHK